jgi:type VI protein secretion system component VasF
MSPEFAAAFDPALLEVLSLAERARNGTNASPDQEQARVRAAIERGGSRLPGTRSKDWELASYALTSLADELLIADVSWPSQTWWENHKLEFALFGSNNRATWFFDRAEHAVGLTSRDTLEAFMLAVVLGFRGMFRDRPDALEAWLRRQEALVKVGQGRPTLPEVGGELSGAPPLFGRANLLWAGLATAMALACSVVAATAWLWSWQK